MALRGNDPGSGGGDDSDDGQDQQQLEQRRRAIEEEQRIFEDEPTPTPPDSVGGPSGVPTNIQDQIRELDNTGAKDGGGGSGGNGNGGGGGGGGPPGVPTDIQDQIADRNNTGSKGGVGGPSDGAPPSDPTGGPPGGGIDPTNRPPGGTPGGGFTGGPGSGDTIDPGDITTDDPTGTGGDDGGGPDPPPGDDEGSGSGTGGSGSGSGGGGGPPSSSSGSGGSGGSGGGADPSTPPIGGTPNDPFGLENNSASRYQDEAYDLETDVVSQSPHITRDDIQIELVERDGKDVLAPLFSGEAQETWDTIQERSFASDLGVSPEDIDVEDGSVEATTERGETALEMSGIEQSFSERYPDATSISIEGVSDDIYDVRIETGSGEVIEETVPTSDVAAANLQEAADASFQKAVAVTALGESFVGDTNASTGGGSEPSIPSESDITKAEAVTEFAESLGGDMNASQGGGNLPGSDAAHESTVFPAGVAQQKIAAAVQEREAAEDARGRAFAEMTPMEKLGADVPDDEPRPVEFFQGEDGEAKFALFGEKDDIPAGSGLTFGDAVAEGFSQSDIGQAIDASATELTPHVGMTAGGNEMALRLRAEKEKRMAELAESGWEDLTSGRAPSDQEMSGLLFQSSEIVERYLVEKAHDLEQASPTHDPAPGEQLGDVPGNVFGGIIGGIGMGIGAVGQHKPSVKYDLKQQFGGVETASSELGAGGLAKNTAESQVEMFRERPGSSSILIAAPVVGRGITSFESGYAAGAGRPSYTGRVPRPTVEAVDTGGTTGYTAGIKWGGGKVESGRPVVSAVRGGEGRTPFEIGRFEANVGETAPTPRGPLETSIVDFTLGGRESTRIKSFRETQAETQYSGLRPDKLESYVGDVLESHGGPREAAPDVIKMVKQDEGAIYGSLTQKAAAERVGEPGVLRTPRDIDVADLSSKSDFAKRVTEAINERAGEEAVRIEDGTPTSVETGSKIFDLHEAEAPQPGSYFASDASFGVHPEAAIKSTEGVRTTTLSEQTARKGQGAMDVLSLEPREVGDVRSTLAPEHAGRVKDIGDFYTGELANIRGLEARGKPRRASKARESLESWLETWGDDISTRVRRDYETYGVEDATMLGDFSGTSRTESAPAPSAVSASSAGASPLPSDGLPWHSMDVSTVGTGGSGSPSSLSPTGSSSRWNPFSGGGGSGSESAGGRPDFITDTSGSRASSDRPGSGGGVFDSSGLFMASTGISGLFSEISPSPTGSDSGSPTGSAAPSGSSFFSPGTTSGGGSPSGGSTPPSSSPPSLSFPTGSSIFSPGSSVPPYSVPSFPEGSSPPPGGDPTPGGSMPPSGSANQSDRDDDELGGLIPVNTPFVNPIVGGQQALTANFAGITQSLPGFGTGSNDLEEAMDIFTGGWGGND